MSFSLLNTLDTTKLKKKEYFVEYILNVNGCDHSFLVKESVSADFEKQFSTASIKTIKEFADQFGEIICELKSIHE